MVSYSFAKGIKDLVQLENRLRESSLAIPINAYVRDNVLTLIYNNEISTEQLTSLQEFLTGYQEVFATQENFCDTFVYAPINIETTTWRLIRAWTYPGRINKEPIMVNIDCSLEKENDSDYVEYRFYDSENNVVIAQGSFDNTYKMKQQMMIDGSKLPTMRSVFELHGRVSNSNAKGIVYTACVMSN